MNYVDLYQIHRLDTNIPIEEILRSLNYLIERGQVLHIGASSMYAWQFAKSLWIAEKHGLEGFKTMQNHYNLVYREEEREMIPLCKDQNIGIIPWSPLARGFLTGKYSLEENPDTPRYKYDKYLKNRYFQEQDFVVVSRLVELAKEKDVSPAQIALAWLFSKDEITAPIIGITKIHYLEEAVEALRDQVYDLKEELEKETKMTMRDYFEKENGKRQMMEELTEEEIIDGFFNLLKERNRIAEEFTAFVNTMETVIEHNFTPEEWQALEEKAYKALDD